MTLLHEQDKKMLSILQDSTKKVSLQIEMAAVVDAVREFVKCTYKLEGDDALVLDCYECLQSVVASNHVSHFPNVDAITNKITADPNVQHQLKLYVMSCIKPGSDYFISKYTGDLGKQIGAFKAPRLLVPHKVVTNCFYY